MNDLIVSDLSVKRADLLILHDIQFAIKRHSMAAIVGPNGGGKSTLIKALLGLLPSTGTITWHETKLRYLPPLDQINRKGLPPLTIGDFLSFNRAHHHEGDKLLTCVGLAPSIKKRYFHELSTGEFQRMCLAWTLLGDPAVILLDEPTAGLDLEGEQTIFAFLKDLPEVTVIIATHHIHSALDYADQILCINRTQLCDGTPATVTLETIKHLYGERHDR